MFSLLIYYLLTTNFQLITVSAQTSLSQPATGPNSVCEGSDVTLHCVIISINPNDNSTIVRDSLWTRNGAEATGMPNHKVMFNSTTGGFTDLLITNVTLADDNTVFNCTASGVTITSSVILNVTGGPPGDINNITIPSDTVTTCSFAVQWSRPSSNPFSYTVTISSEGVMIMTDNTTMTNYSATGLNNNTEYHVNVTANNICGSSRTATMKTTTKSGGTNIGLPSSPTSIIITPLNSTSFIVKWTISDPSYIYTVIWTSPNTNVMDRSEALQNRNNYIITGFNDNYTLSVSIITADVCGIIISDPITFNNPPLVTIRKDKICTTSVIISLIIDSHPSCGNVSCNVTISGNVMNSDTDDSSKYTIDELESNATYKITVTYAYNNGFSLGEFNEVVKTVLPKSPNPVSVNTIQVKSEGKSVIVAWKPPAIDECNMIPIQHYEVIVYSGEVEVASENTNNATTFSFKHLNDQSTAKFTISITVIDIYGQRSNSTVTVKTVAIESINGNNGTINELSTSKTNERRCEIFIGLVVVFIAISVITTTIIVILSWKLCCSQKKTDDVVTVPPPQFQGQMNIDNIQMQPSPAYASIDNKSSHLYQNI